MGDFAKVEAGQNVADAMASARSKRPEIPPRTQSSYQSKPSCESEMSLQAWATLETPRKMVPDTGGDGYSPIKTAKCTEYTINTPRGAASPPRDASQRSASPTTDELTCRCGFSCGTESAMRKHLNRFKGEPGHRLV